MIGLRVAFLALAFATAAGAARADDVTNEIDRARLLYNQGKVSEAKQALDMASQLLTQHKAKLLGDVLPPAMAGWTTSEMDSSALGANLMGGGIAASRIYRKGPESCLISVVGDSPAMAMVSVVFSNPTLAAAAGARVQRIAGQRGLITSDGEVQVISANNYLVTISGACREADKIAYAGSVDYEKLGRL